MIIDRNKTLYYLQKDKPITNVVFVTDDEDLLKYADYKKYFGIYINKDFFELENYKKYAHHVAKDIIIIEDLIESYIVSVDEQMLSYIISILSLPIHYLDKNFVKMSIYSVLNSGKASILI